MDTQQITTQRLSAYPHILTAPGSTVVLSNVEGEFVVLSGFVSVEGSKKRNVYFLRSEKGEPACAVNGWKVVGTWAQERTTYLYEAAQELEDLLNALHIAVHSTLNAPEGIEDDNSEINL